MRIFLLLFFIPFFAVAQESDEQLAAQYMADEEFDKAQILYEKLLKKNPESVYFYQNYFTCLTRTKDFEGADKLIKRQIKKQPDNPSFQVDQAFLYQLKGDAKAAQQAYDQLIKSVNEDENKTIKIASAFQKRNLREQAITCLLEGRKKAGYATAFAPELMALYREAGEWKKLSDESVQLILQSQDQLENVQSQLVHLLNRESELNYLKERILLQLQKTPDKSALDQLLLWVFIQKKEFRSAFRQVQSMEKKNQNPGNFLIEFANLCRSNDQYELAIESYQQLIQLGSENNFYLMARSGLLETRYMAISTRNYEKSELEQLEKDFLDFLNTYGKTPNTSASMKQLAECYVFYFHDLTKGIALLEELATMPRVQPKFNGSCKLSLGDAYLMRGDIWDAQLMYGQVDKDFLEDPLGQEARLRNAKLSYFTGDFEWAKDQLDVLKTATSQLISNNAIELSMVIMDNTGLDSSTEALKKFAEAELFYFQQRYDESLKILNLMPFQFPKHSLEDDIYLLKARIMSQNGQIEEAEKNYQMVIQKFGGDILADNALMELALIYQHKTGQKEKALELYQKLVFNYTGSLFTVEARKQILKLQAEVESDKL